MHTSRRSQQRIKLLLPLLVAIGATTSGSSAPYDQQAAFTVPSFSEEDRVRYQESLIQLLRSPCDDVEAPLFNEIHDCQRFVVGRGAQPEFGSLMGIFPNVNVIEQAEAIYDTPQVAAYITNAGGALDPGDTYEDTGYPSLQIQPRARGSTTPGGYCLWLRREPAGPTARWAAAITPGIDTSGRTAECSTIPEESDWRTLQVTRQMYLTDDGPAPRNWYPNTARWLWTTPERFAGEHYIGVKCGAAMCAVSRRGIAPVPIPAQSQVGNVRRAIPGFLDGQFLAVGAPGQLRPGPWAEVHPLLPARPPTAPPLVGFYRAARIVVRGDNVDPYRQKMELMEVSPGTWVSWVDIQTANAAGPLPQPEARYRNWDGADHPARGVRTGASGHGPHGSARWRWQRGDETFWLPCDGWGCCDVEEGG